MYLFRLNIFFNKLIYSNTFKMNKIKLDDASRFDKVSFCFKKCVNSFEEKAVSPYERECLYPCIEN